MQRPPARPPRLRRCLGRLERGRLLDHDRPSSSDTTGSIATDTAPRIPCPVAAGNGFLGRALPRQSGRSGRGGPLRPGATRRRSARPGRGRARAGGDPQPEQSRRARRLWPGARGQRQLSAGARRAQPRAHAGPARLAHPFGPGRGARSDGPPCRRPAALRQCVAADARRAVGAVQSRAVLRALEEP